jgi:hypothetical protein
VQEARRSRRGEVVRTAIVAAIAAAAASGAAVWADGGDPSVAHACVLDQRAEGEPNVVVVEPNEACPGQSTPIHLAFADAVVSPEQLETPAPDTAVDATALTAIIKPKFTKKVYKPLGIKAGLKTTVSKLVDEGALAFGYLDLAGFAACPGSHPYRLLGSYRVTGGTGYVTPLVDSPLGVSGWYTKVRLTRWSVLATTYRLFIDLTCAKVTPPGN